MLELHLSFSDTQRLAGCVGQKAFSWDCTPTSLQHISLGNSNCQSAHLQSVHSLEAHSHNLRVWLSRLCTCLRVSSSVGLPYSVCFSVHITLRCLPRPETARLNYKHTNASRHTEDSPELQDKVIFYSLMCKGLLGNTFLPAAADTLPSLLASLVSYFTRNASHVVFTVVVNVVSTWLGHSTQIFGQTILWDVSMKVFFRWA